MRQFDVLTRFLYDPGLAAWIQLCKMSECVLKIIMKPMPSLSLIRCNVKCYDLLRLRTLSKLFTFGYFLFARKLAVLLHTILSHCRKLTCTPDVPNVTQKKFKSVLIIKAVSFRNHVFIIRILKMWFTWKCGLFEECGLVEECGLKGDLKKFWPKKGLFDRA